ncbi:hypothetical protein [Natronobacterium texcoconense]|uniref:Uncharacterized protein n=1 Tax=Natronobacterium texcoconense TaxID=1095778 RepID=A0A1H1EPC2_NATTX|nr:hypothetical protein [Natronobacterium texcoconense]SDQ90408.1 hypothetical protein SAMN04489842_1646 [Natronobacterium texcoconense]
MRRQRWLAFAGFASPLVVAVGFLLALILAGAGWVILAGIFLVPVAALEILLSVIYGIPLLIAGRWLANENEREVSNEEGDSRAEERG